MDDAKLCDELAERMGYKVRHLEQRRASKIHIGTPDRRYVGKHAFFFEIKIGPDRLTREQYAFLRDELNANALASCGALAELRDLLSALQRNSLVHARNVCELQVAGWKGKGFRGERKPVLARTVKLPKLVASG